MIKSYSIKQFLLQPVVEKDREFYIQLHCDPFIMKNIARPLTLSQANKSFDICLANNLSRLEARYTWIIIDKHSGKNAGICALVLKDKKFNGTSFGILLAEEFHGQGNGRTILAGIMEYGVREKGIEHYVGYSILGNEISYRLMISLNFDYKKEDSNSDRPAGYYWFKKMKHKD